MLSLTVFLPVDGGGQLPDGFPESALPLTTIQQRPATAAGTEEVCELCGGIGRLEFGDLCLRCRGMGNLRAIRLMRVNCDEHDERFEHLLSAKEWAEQNHLRTKLFIKFMESGRRLKDGTCATTVISGIRGEQLEAQRIEINRNPARATFWLVRALRIEFRTTSEGPGKGTVDLVDLDPRTTKPRAARVWEFEPGGKPVSKSKIRVAFPEEAAGAAILKATAEVPTPPWVRRRNQ